jgi:nicotinamidase-related amidase
VTETGHSAGTGPAAPAAAGQAPGITLAAGPGNGQWRSLPGPPGSGALVVIDVQRSFADPAYYRPGSDAAGRAVAGAVARVGELATAARRNGLRVVWVRLEQTEDQPWLASAWLRGGQDDETGEEPCLAGTPGAKWFGPVPEPGETVITKRFYSGFLGTGLAEFLRGEAITWLLACGLTTECCVAATAQDGIQLGFRVLISSDATAAYDLDWHRQALEMLSVNVGLVATTEDIITALDQAAGPSAR